MEIANPLKKGQRRRKRQEAGFTLMELLVAVTLSLIAMAAIYSAYVTQQRAYQTTQDMTAIQQNLRAGMYFLEKDLRMAGYDPLDSGSFGFTNMAAQSFKYTWDADEDGFLDPATEYVIYKFESPEPTLERDRGDGSFNDIASEISNITFYYYDSSGVTAVTTGSIRTVLVYMTAERGGHERTLKSKIWCRNSGL